MRKLFALLFLSASIISCSSDDSANYEGSQSDLTGVWKLSNIQYEGIDITNECRKNTTITVSSNGQASWSEYSGEPCVEDTDSFVFTALNVNFDIEDNSNFTNYYGKFHSKNEIEITVIFNDNDGLESETIYKFVK